MLIVESEGESAAEVKAWMEAMHRVVRPPSMAESIEVAQDAVMSAVREVGRGMHYEQIGRALVMLGRMEDPGNCRPHPLGVAFQRAASNLRLAGMMRFATSMVGATEPERVAEGVARRMEFGALLAESLPAERVPVRYGTHPMYEKGR